MSVRPIKVLGVVLLLGGAILLLLSVFGYERRESEAEIGPLHVAVVESERLPVPPWVGMALVVVGGALLLWPLRR